MTFSIHGLAVARGIAVGRAVLVASSRVDVAHYFIEPQQIEQELDRINQSRHAVMLEVQRIQKTVPKDAPPERHCGISAEHHVIGARINRQSLFKGDPLAIEARDLTLLWVFVDIRGNDGIGRQAQRCQ